MMFMISRREGDHRREEWECEGRERMFGPHGEMHDDRREDRNCRSREEDYRRRNDYNDRDDCDDRRYCQTDSHASGGIGKLVVIGAVFAGVLLSPRILKWWNKKGCGTVEGLFNLNRQFGAEEIGRMVRIRYSEPRRDINEPAGEPEGTERKKKIIVLRKENDERILEATGILKEAATFKKTVLTVDGVEQTFQRVYSLMPLEEHEQPVGS